MVYIIGWTGSRDYGEHGLSKLNKKDKEARLIKLYAFLDKEMEENNRFMKKHDLRHIQKIEETDDSIIIYYGKNVDDVEMIDEQDKEMDESEHTPYHDDEEKSEVRTNPNKEVRTFDVQDLELRMDGDKPTVVGYGAVFNSMSNDLGGFREFIAPNAFEGRL